MMRGSFGALALALVFTIIGQAEATWCTDNPGSIFCFDFDRACVGPPADPTEPCPLESDRSDPAIRGTWEYNSWNVNTQSKCGSNMCGEEILGILPSHPYGGRHANGGDESGQLGQNTVNLEPYIEAVTPQYTTVNGSDDEPLVLTFTMGSLALGAMQFNNGYMELSLGDPDRWLAITSQAKAVTDFVLVGGADTLGCTNCNSTCTGTDASVSVVAWPTICQQEFPHPLCPPKQTIVRNALAVGALSMLDNNPCHCCTVGYEVPNRPWRKQCVAEERNADFPDGWQEPTNTHLSYFDGLEWRVLREGMGGPGSFGDFRYGNYWIYLVNSQGQTVGNTDSGWEMVVITIKTSTVDIYHKTKMVNQVDGQWVESWKESMAYGLPRHYTGDFNRLRAGTDESCQLVEQGDANYDGTYKCDPAYANGHRKCKVMKEERCDPTGGNATFRASYVSFDNVRLGGGIGNTQVGACCLSDATCVETDKYACETVLRGRYQGAYSTCAETVCCPYPFADADHDGDVDQDDFGAFQLCYNGAGAVPTGCGCFDRNADGKIDSLDFAAFSDCFTEANVPWSQVLTPSCAP